MKVCMHITGGIAHAGAKNWWLRLAIFADDPERQKTSALEKIKGHMSKFLLLKCFSAQKKSRKLVLEIQTPHVFYVHASHAIMT